MATEAVIIQEPISIVEKMATEAVIIAEPISLVKTEESKHLTLEVGASNNGVETANVVAEGNHEIAKGESFLMSPEISKVSNETCGVLDHTEVDGTPFKAEKIPEDEEKTAVRIKDEAGTRGIEKGDTVAGIEELEKQASMDSHDPSVESLKDAKETVTEASSTEQVNEVDDTKPEKLPAEAGKDRIILDSLGETLTEKVAEGEEIACMDEPEVDEKLEEVSSEEIKCTNGENDGIQDKNSVMKTEELPLQAELPVGNEHEKPHEFSGIQPEEQGDEATGASEKKEEDSEDVSKACQSRDSTNPEHIFTEAAATIDLKSETSRTVEENVKEDSEDCTAETMNEKSEEENTAATMSIKEVHKEHETAAAGTVKENTETMECPVADISNSSISDETVEESMKEGESRPMKSTEEVSNSNIEETDSIEETENPDNDPSPFNVKDSKEEVIPIEVKEDHVHSSPIELEESGKDTEEETNVNGDEAEGEKNEIHTVGTIEEIGVATEHEGIGVNSANIDVNSTDSSVTCNSNVEISEPRKDGMQDGIPNAGSEDHIELTNKEIQLKEVPEDEVKEHSTVPSEEYEATPSEERKITDETSKKDQYLYEHLEKVAVDVKVVPDTDKEPPVVMEVLDEMKRDEESTVIEAENVNLVWQSEEEKSKEEIPESFQQKNEPEKEKPVCPLNVVSEDVNTTTSGETVETSTNIEEVTSVEDHEERSEEEGREDSPTDHLQIEVNEHAETVKAEISNKNADDVHVADSSIGQPVKNEHEKQHEFSDVQPEERVLEAIGASKEKEENSEDVSNSCQSRDVTNPEQTFPEAAATTTDLKSKTSEMENENPMFVEEVDLLDSKNFSESLEALENKQEGIQQELEDCTADATENIEEIHDSPKLIIKEECAIIDDSLKTIEEGEKEEIPEVKVGEKLEIDYIVENAEKQIIQEDNKDHTTLKEVCKGSETAASGTAKEEINLIEFKEELVHSSSFELEESEEKTEKETSVISTADLDYTSHVAETEETKIVEVETETDMEEEKNEINNEGIGVESTDIDVKSADSYITSEKDMEIPREEDGMQDRIPNQGSKNQMEMPTKEIQLKEVLEDEMKEPYIMPLEELRKDEESVISMPEGNIREVENIGFIQQNREGNSKDEIFENFQKKDESEKKPASPLNVVYEDVNTAISGDAAESSTNIEEATSINDHEERSEGERREEPPTEHRQIEANENYETVEVEVSNETADDLHVTDSFIGQPVDNEHEKQNEFSDVQPVENEALENKEEEILQEPEDCSAEKPEPKDAVENVEDNLKQEETNEIHEGPTLIVKEDCAITDDSLKFIEEDENEETPRVEVCENLELDKTVEIAEKQILDEEDNNGQTTLTAEMMEEKAKEENTAAMVSITEASNSVIEEDHVCSSSFELEESKNDTEEETPASCAEETDIKGAEAAEENNERNNVVVEERGLETTQLEGIGVYSAEMNVKSPTEKDREIPREIDAMQDKVPNAGSEDQWEINAEEIPSKEILGYEVKEYEPALIEEREISDETSEKDRDLYEHSEIPPSQATDEKLMQNEDSPQSGVPKAQPEDTGKESKHGVKEQLVEEPNVEVTNVSTEEVHSEQDNQTDASEAKTLQDEKPSDFGLKTEQKEDGKLLDEAADLEETVGEENLAKNLEETESLKEDSEIGKEDQIPGVIIVNDNAKVEDYNSVSNECLNEAESKEQIVAENLEVEEDSANDGEASHVMEELEETRQSEESGDPVSVHSEDREAEKKTEFIHDLKQCHEDSCIEAVTEVRAETSLNNTYENSKALKTSSVETNPEIVESDANQETEVENVQLEEISSGLDPDVQKQNIEHEIRIENPVEKIEEETQKETEIEHEIQEDSSETKTIEEVCLLNEDQRELKAVSEEETIAGQDPQNDEHEEHIKTASSTLPSEESEHGTGAITEEIKYSITKEEVQTKLDVATGDEVTGEQTTSLPLVSREKDKTNETDRISDKISEGFSVAETTTELCLEKEELLELDDAKKDDAEKEGEKTKEEKTIKDAKDEKTRLEICSQTERSVELEAVGEDETTVDETLAEKISDAQVPNPTTALSSREDVCESTLTAEMIESEKTPDEDASLQKDRLREDEALAVDDDASSQVILTEKRDDLPDPVDALPTDHLHPTTSTLLSGVQGDEKKEIELEEEEESREKIPEQTQEIEEASDFNTERQEKAFKIELLDKTEDVAIQEKLVKARTEAGEIILDEISAEKNVVLAGFEDKSESESAPVAEDQSEETFPESSNSQDDETNIDLHNQETEKQMKEEPNDKLEDGHIINRDQSTNETKAVIFSEEVDKEVETAEASEGIKEYIMEKESSTNEIHPVLNGDEAINEVEDYTAVSTECIQEAKSEEQIQAENSEVEKNPTNEKEGSPVVKELDEAEKGLIAVTVDELNKDHELGETKSEASKTSNADELGKIDDIGPPDNVLEVKPEEKIQTSVCTLLSEDEEIRIENPVEKIEEEAQKDTEIEHEIQEDSSETKTIEEVCLSNEEQRELKAFSGEETIADQDPQNDGPEEQIQTASSTLPSEESEHGTGAISEEIKYGITKEEVQTKLDDATGDEVTGEQTTSPPLVSREKDAENIYTVEKTEENTNKADMIPDKISEGFSVAETTTELCLEKEDEKTKEEETIKDEIEEDAKDAKTRLEICSQTERSVELEAVGEDETTAVETLTEKISDEQVLNLTTAFPTEDYKCESTITAEMTECKKTPDEDASLQKDQLREDEALAVDNDASSQVILTEKPDDLPDPVDTLPTDHLHPTTSTLPSEVQEDEKKEIELEEEEESHDKIPEQTQEIEETSEFNTQIHEKAFKNELLDETEDVAIQEKLVKARTEAGEIILDEVSADKVIVEAQKTSEDKTVEAPGQASVASIESTAVIEENVVLADFEEKPESEPAPVAENQSEETFPESSKSLDDETSIDVQNQETEEQMIEELKDKLEDEHIINREQNTNETKAVILSEEVDKEVEKAEGSEGINEVEDYSADSTECFQEAKSEEQIQAENSEVEENSTNEKEGSPVMKGLDEAEKGLIAELVDELNMDHELIETKSEFSNISDADELGKIDDIGPPNTVLEVKPEEQIQTSVCTLLSKDEEIRIENPVEEIEEETQKETEIEHESKEESSETKTIEEVCLSNEEQIELKAISEEETISDQDPQNDEPEEQIQTASSTLPSEESEHGTGAISEEIKYGITKEEVQTKVDAATGDEVTDEQTTVPPLVSRERNEENICTVDKTEEEKINEADMIPDKISGGFSVAETIQLRLEKEELLELNDAEKEGEKTKEEETIKDETEQDAKQKTRLEICSQTERSVELEVVGEDETTSVETLAEKISDAQVLNQTTALPSKEEESESNITAETAESEKTPDEDASLLKDRLREDEALAVDDDPSSQVILTEKPDILPDPVDTLPTDHLHPTTSTLPSEVQGDEKKEIELEEEEEKSPEQTQEIEEASDFNTEINEKAFKNELLDETDVAIQEKLVKARTEAGEIILDEVSAEKVIVEAQKSSENEDPVEDKTVEAPGQASAARIERTAVIEENVVLTGFEEKPESESAPVAEDQREETFPESSKSQDDENNIDVQNQETEEQMKDELKDKLEDEHIISREQNTSETKAVILSEEVDKEVEKAGGSEAIKEYVMEKESSTNEIHPVPKGDQAVNEVEDYSAVSAECIEEAKSEEQIQAENSEVEENSTNDKEGSPVMKELDEGKQDKESGDPVNVHGEDKEAEEKDEVIDDLKLGHDMSHSEAVTEERAETSLNDTEVNIELVNTLNISTVKMSLENSESDASQETEEVEKVQLEEISSGLAPEVPTNNNDDVNKRDADEFYITKDKIVESENGLSEEKVDELNQYEFVETKSESSKKSLTVELEADKVEETEGVLETSSDHTSQRVETNVKDDDSSTNTSPEVKSEEQLQSSTHTLLCENEEITTARPIEKIEEEIPNDARIKHESREDSSCTKSVEEACSLNEEQRELKTVSEEETIADKSLPNDEPEAVLESERNTPRAIAEEPEEPGATEEKKIKEDESFEDEKLQQSECTRELQGALEDGETAVRILPSETSADNLHATASTLPSEVKENQATETESKEDKRPKNILEQTEEIEEASNLNKETCKKPFELLSETDAAANEIIARDETGGEGNKYEKTEEGNEITANEDSKEEVMEDKEVTEKSYSTSQPEESMKDSYGEDELKEKLMEDKTHEELKTSEIEMIENQIKDKTIEDQGQGSVAKIETTAVTEENVAIAGFEEKPKSETEQVIEDQSNETIPENTRSQDEGTSLDVPDQETEEQIKEKLKDKLEDEDSINREENANEVTKGVILSEEVDKEVGKTDGSDDIKENFIEKESSTNEIHPVSNIDEATNELEDYGAVSTECIQEAKFKEQIQAENSEVEENSTNDKEGSHIMKELDERKQDEKSVDPVNVHSEDREAEEKDDLKLGHGESHSEAVTEERAETSLNDTEVKKELVDTSNISSAKMSLENIGSDANQETEEVEKLQLREISSDLAPKVPTKNNDEVEVIKRDLDEFYTAKDQNAEAENGLTVQKVDQLNQDHELIETKSEPSNKSLTAELEATEVEETEAVPETLSDHTSQRIETILKDDDSSTDTFPEEKPAEQLQSSTRTLFSEDEEIRTARPIEKIEEEIQNDAGIKHKIGEDSLDTKIIEEVLHQEGEALAEDNIDNASAPNILSEKPEEQIQNPAVTLPSEEHKHETINEVDKTGEMEKGDSHGEEAVEEKSTEKDETREPEETLEGETNTCQVIPEESEEHGTVTEENKIKEAESFEDEKSTQSECTRELQGSLEDGAAAVHILPGETSAVNLHPATSTLPSVVRGNETKETELQEDESPEKIQEQTREIEEVSNFNIETCGRAFDNELLTETEDAANEKKIAITNEIAVIEVLKEEVMEDKEVTETSYSTSHVEEMIKDGSGEDELKDKLIQDNKNVEPAPPGFEEKPESDLEPVAEDQRKETLPEHTKSQDDETRTDVQNRETEEQIKEELKDKVEAEGSINGEQNKNEVTKAVILSEEVDGSEDIKEHVIEEESSTNELHPVSKGDETTNEVEDYRVVSIESIEAAESEEQIQAGNSEDEENSTNNKEGSHIMKELDERRQDEESRDHINVHGEDREAEEKVEIEGVPELLSDNVPPRFEETILKVDSISTNTFVEEKSKEQLQSSACTLLSIPSEEQRELKAVSEEETIADKVLPNDEPKEHIQTTPLTFPSGEREHGTGAISEEIEYGKTKEEVPINLDVVTGDEITGKQTHETNKPEEITSSPLVSMEKEANISLVEQIEEEKLGDAEIPEKISENPFDAKKAAETCLENEAIKELDDAKKDTQALQMEESNEQFFTSELPVENLKHRTEANDEEEVKEVEMLEKEGPQEPEAVIDQETVVARASITEESQKIETISTVEMLDEEERKEAVKVEEKKCEDSSAGETEKLNEFHLVTKEETTSYLAFSEEKRHSFSASAITSEESEHETKEKEDEKTNEGEIIKYEIEEDASDAKATVEICSQKGSSVEVEAVAEDEMTADEAETESKKIEEAEFLQNDSGEDATLQKELLHGGEALVVENNASLQTIPTEKPEEQIPNLVVTLPSEEHKHGTISEVDKTEEGKIKEEMKNGDSDGVKTVEEVSTEKYQTKEAVAVFEEDESLEKIREQTGEVEASSDINMEINEKGLDIELLDETEDATLKENIGKAIDGSGGEANQYEKINEGNEIILNEVSKEEVTSHSTSQSEDATKDGNDALKNELIEDKTYKELIVEAQKTSENEITEKQIKDGVVKNPDQASVVRNETTTVTEDHLENMGITSSVVEEYVLIDLQERVVECLQRAEIRDVKETYPDVVEHGVEKTEDKSVEDSTKISSPDGVDSFKETEEENMGEVEIIKDETQKDASDTRTTVEICSQVDTSVKLEAFTENEMTSGQTLTAKKSEELQNPTSAPHSKEEQCLRASISEEIESEKMEEEEFLQGDNEEDATFQKEQPQGDEALAVENKASLQTIPTEKSEERIPNPVVTLSSEEHKHETVNEFDKPEEVKNRDFDGGKTVEELSTEKDEIKGAAAMSEGEINHLHITASALPSDVQGDETNKTESKENVSPAKIPEQTGETEEASNFTPEIHEKASDNEIEDAAIKENIVKESDGFAQTNEGNDIILNEVSKEEIISYSTSHSEELTEDASQEDAVKDERIEDKTYEELMVESQKPSENEMNEKQIDGGGVEEQVQASVVRIETTTESSTELSVAEGKQILEYIQQTGETTKTASDMQIPRELDHIENTGITSLVAEEHVPVYLQDRVAESSQKTEVREIYPGGLECGGEITADCSGGEVTEKSILTQDSIKISSSDNVESFAKEASQVPQDIIEGDAKDENKVSQILQAEKSEKQSLAPVDAVVEELKEVETRDKSTSDTKTGGEICLEKEENKEPKAVVVQETIVTQAPQTKDPVSHFEDSSQEDEHAGDETNETFKIPTHEIQNEKPSVEIQKDDANDNIRKETVAEEKTVKDDMSEAPIVREEIPGKEDPIECKKTTNSTGNQQFPTEQRDEAFETSDKAVVGDLEPGTAKDICSEAGVASGKGETPDNLGAEKPEEPESADSAKLSLHDLLQRSTRETIQGTKNVIEERELKVSNEEPPEEEAKTDEEVEGDENSKTESGTKPHKKSHNILSGMGSKVKHSISKMKKAITGKSSQSKESKPISPKESKK